MVAWQVAYVGNGTDHIWAWVRLGRGGADHRAADEAPITLDAFVFRRDALLVVALRRCDDASLLG
jgi:hypothetical protein